MGLGLQRRQRRLGHLPDRLRRGRQGPDRGRHRHPDDRPRTARRSSSRATPRSDPEGGPITYAWDFNGDGNVDSTDPNPSYTYTANGAYTAKLTVKDQTGLTGVENIPITVGNRAPVITFQTPIDGQAASFTDTVPYKLSVTDPEDGTTGNGISCDDVKVTVSLGHDEHAHDLSSTTGCEGTLHTGLTSGHGPEANTFTVITVTYTDKGGPGGIVPLTGRAQVDPAAQDQAGGVLRLHRPGRRRRRPTGDAGVMTEDTADDQGGGKNIGFIEDGDYVSYKPVNLTNLNELRFRVASAGAGGTIEVHLDSPTGTLVGTTETITPTGGWQKLQDGLAAADQPAGRDARAVPRVPQARAARRIAVQRQLARVRRQGRRGHRRAGRDRERRPGLGHGAADRQVHRHGHRPRRAGDRPQLRLGLRRARHRRRQVDRGEPDATRTRTRATTSPR